MTSTRPARSRARRVTMMDLGQVQQRHTLFRTTTTLIASTNTLSLTSRRLSPFLNIHKMSNTKRPMSGLRSIKRDFSSSSLPPVASQESLSSDPDTIPWQPTPPKKLSGLEQRLKDIQDALNAQVSSSETVLASSQSQKRPSTSQDPPAKRRQLPASWNDKPQAAAQAPRPAYPSASSQRAFGKARQTNTNETLVVAAKSGSASKPAPVFLSQEQTHILKLVESGLSLFYTGSAGEFRGIYKSKRVSHIRSPGYSTILLR